MKKKVTRKFKSGGLHEKHVVATWKHVGVIIVTLLLLFSTISLMYLNNCTIDVLYEITYIYILVYIM